MNVRWAGAVVLAALLCAASARAQDLKPGDKVRLSGPFEGSPRVVYVVENGPDELVVRRGKRDKPVQMPLASLHRVDVSRGKKRMVVEGLVAGAVIGSVSVIAVGWGGAHGEYAMWGGAYGAALGSLMGLALQTDRWERVETRPRPRVGLGMVPGPGPAAGLRVSF